MKKYGGVDVLTHVFLTSAIIRGEWSASRPGRFTHGERAPDTHWIGGWVGPRGDLDDMGKWKFFAPPGLELRPLGGTTQYILQIFMMPVTYLVVHATKQ
jgi:hypothetical protein